MARTTQAARRDAQRRHAEIMEASADERRRLNEAIARGAVVTLDTFIGPRTITRVTDDFWYHDSQGRSWAGCNDGDWAQMLHQAGVARNQRWEHLAFSSGHISR